MIIGGVMVFVGLIVGFFCHTTYTAGRQAYVSHDLDGTSHHPEEAPGDPWHKLGANMSFVTAGVGGLLLLFSMPAYLISRPRGRDLDKKKKVEHIRPEWQDFV